MSGRQSTAEFETSSSVAGTISDPSHEKTGAGTPRPEEVARRKEAFRNTVVGLGALWQVFYPYYVSGGATLAASPAPVLCCCKRKRNSVCWNKKALALHLQHYDEPDIWFATIMADIFYPFGTKLSLSWLKKRLECNVNIMNACASHGSIVTARNLLRDYIKQFGFFPAVIPGALYFAISHCQFDFLQEWVSDSPFRVLFNSSDQNELLPTRLLQDGRNRNLYVAICMGIALAWRSALRATDQADKARFESQLTRLLQLINTGLLMTTHNYRRELLEIASYAGALPLVEVIFEKSKKFLIFDDYDPREPFMNSLHNAAAGGNHEICQLLLLKTSVRGSFPFNLSLSTLLLSAACRNQQYFTEICNMLREAFVKTSLWTLLPSDVEFQKYNWVPFTQAVIADSAAAHGQWGILRTLLSPGLWQRDDKFLKCLPRMLCSVAKFKTTEALSVFKELYNEWKGLTSDKLPSDFVKTILKNVCSHNNSHIFQLLVAHPAEFNPEIERLLTDLLAAALMPTSKHIHKLYEDLFGLTQKEIASLPDDVSRRRVLRKPTYEVATGLLQFFGARKISDQTPPGEKSSKVYREDVKIDGVLVELIKKGCDYDAMQWLIDKQLLCSELVDSPTDLLRRLLSARPLPKKGGTEPFFIIGYRKLNKHVSALQRVISWLSSSLSVEELEDTLCTSSTDPWPVTLFCLQTCDRFRHSVTVHVSCKFTFYSLAAAIFVDLSTAGKFFDVDETKGLPSLFGWLVSVCPTEGIKDNLRMFFVNGCEEVLAKLPDQERVETFKVKAKCILGLDKGDSCCTSTADSTSTFPSPSTGGYIRDMLNPHRPLTQQRKPFKRYSHTFPRRQKVLTLPQSWSQPEVQEKPQSERQRKNQNKNRKRKSTETATTEATTTANTNTSTAAVSTPASLPPPPQIVPSSPSDNDNNADADKETPTEPSPKVNRPNTSSQ